MSSWRRKLLRQEWLPSIFTRAPKLNTNGTLSISHYYERNRRIETAPTAAAVQLSIPKSVFPSSSSSIQREWKKKNTNSFRRMPLISRSRKITGSAWLDRFYHQSEAFPYTFLSRRSTQTNNLMKKKEKTIDNSVPYQHFLIVECVSIHLPVIGGILRYRQEE